MMMKLEGSENVKQTTASLYMRTTVTTIVTRLLTGQSDEGIQQSEGCKI